MRSDYWKNLREKRRAAGLCLACGSPKGSAKHLAHVRRQKNRQLVTNLVKKTRGYQTALRKRWLIQYRLDHPCSRCGESHPACLDFHHKDPTQKRFALSSPMALRVTARIFNAEFQKCELICANCHRKEHYTDHPTTYFNPRQRRVVNTERIPADGETSEANGKEKGRPQAGVGSAGDEPQTSGQRARAQVAGIAHHGTGAVWPLG